MTTRRCALLLALLLATSACVAPGARDAIDEAQAVPRPGPTFQPDDGDAADTTPDDTTDTEPETAPADPDPDDPASTAPSESPEDPQPADPDPDPDPSATPGPAPASDRRAGSITDPSGDLAGDTQGAPTWVDLVGAGIEVEDGRGRIVLRFAATVPEVAGDDQIVSVATFHDLTGDGNIDREIWASLTLDGWGTSFWENDRGNVRFAAEDDVEVTVDGDQVVLEFPAAHLDDVTTARWAVTLEWTRTNLLTEQFAVDDAPDDRSGARWGPA